MPDYSVVTDHTCPKCGHEGSFWVSSTCTALYLKDQYEPKDVKDFHPDDYMIFRCPACNYNEHASYFNPEYQKKEERISCPLCGEDSEFSVTVEKQKDPITNKETVKTIVKCKKCLTEMTL